MVLYDATIGNGLNGVAQLGFAYYFVWIAVTPFIDATHPTQALFPPREYGLVLPAAVVILFVVTATTVASLHIILWNRRPAAAAVADAGSVSPDRKSRGHTRSTSASSARSVDVDSVGTPTLRQRRLNA
jgi:dolichyl-phosphate mannosyltransferase polypeptide 2 regulatory subunit